MPPGYRGRVVPSRDKVPAFPAALLVKMHDMPQPGDRRPEPKPTTLGTMNHLCPIPGRKIVVTMPYPATPKEMFIHLLDDGYWRASRIPADCGGVEWSERQFRTPADAIEALDTGEYMTMTDDDPHTRDVF